MSELVPIKSRHVGIQKLKTESVQSDNSNQLKTLKGTNSVEHKNSQITRDNVQEYLLKDLMEQEKALDEDAVLDGDEEILKHERIPDHDYVRNSLGHDYAGTVIGDIKEEPGDQHCDDLLKFIKKEKVVEVPFSQDDKDIKEEQNKDNIDNVKIKTEPLDNIVLYSEYNMSNITIKEEEIENNLSNVFQVSKDIASVFQASTSTTGVLHEMVKEEPMDEFDYEDDIIVLNNENFTIDEHPLFKSSEEHPFEMDSSELQEDMSKFEPEVIVTNKSSNIIFEPEVKISPNRPQNKVYSSDIQIVSNRILLKSLNDSNKKNLKQRKARWYKCNKCSYEGIYSEFKKHSDLCRTPCKYTKITNDDENELAKENIWDQYYCTKCNCIFFTLKKYIMHFIAHNVKVLCCPVCAIKLPNITRLGIHFISHVKQSYVKDIQSMEKSEQLKKTNKELVTEYEELMKNNDELMQTNNKKIKKNKKLINENEKWMDDDELLMDQDVDLFKQNERLFSANEKLANSNAELISQNDELKKKIDESNTKWQEADKGVVYKCQNCQEQVLSRETFRHFENHLTLEAAPSKSENDELGQNNHYFGASVLSQEIIRIIIGKY